LGFGPFEGRSHTEGQRRSPRFHAAFAARFDFLAHFLAHPRCYAPAWPGRWAQAGLTLSDIDRQKLYRLRYDPGESEDERQEVAAA
jgi:hypothetical protein